MAEIHNAFDYCRGMLIDRPQVPISNLQDAIRLVYRACMKL
jgi:hypothetical protein